MKARHLMQIAAVASALGMASGAMAWGTDRNGTTGTAQGGTMASPNPDNTTVPRGGYLRRMLSQNQLPQGANETPRQRDEFAPPPESVPPRSGSDAQSGDMGPGDARGQ